MDETLVLDLIKSNKIFGAVEVDIHVPEHLKNYFEELTPIFKNTVVKQSDIGDFMQAYLHEDNKIFKDTRYLIGSMFGKKILLITPLLNWYLSKGLLVTKIYQVVEFKPSNCFKSFVDTVTNDRRAGDRDPHLKMIGDTSKLIGKLEREREREK